MTMRIRARDVLDAVTEGEAAVHGDGKIRLQRTLDQNESAQIGFTIGRAVD